MIDKETVRARYPGARVERWNHETLYVAIPPGFSPLFHIGKGRTEPEAWANARAILEAAPDQPKGENS